MPRFHEAPKTVRLTMAVLVGSAALAGGTAQAKDKPDCDVGKQISKIEKNMKYNGGYHRQAVAESATPGFIAEVYAKGDNPKHPKRAHMIRPIAIECADKAIRYVGVTYDGEHTLGKRYATGKEAGEYLDVVKPTEVTVHFVEDFGPNRLVGAPSRLATSHPAIEYTSTLDPVTSEGRPTFSSHQDRLYGEMKSPTPKEMGLPAQPALAR